jgi:hypothetical protein
VYLLFNLIFFIGLDETVCIKGEEGESWIEIEMPQAQNPRVMPNCVYASNPYHECTKNILEDSEIGNLGEEEKKLTTLLAIEGARTSLLGLYAAIFMLIALE